MKLDTRTNSNWTLATMMLALCVTAASANATDVMYVDDDAPSGGLGASWNDACRNLQDALAAARQSGVSELRVAAGVYRPDGGESQILGNRSASFLIEGGMKLRGGYAGLRGRNPDERDINTHRTVLSGDLDGNDGVVLGPGNNNRSDNSHHVVVSVDAGSRALLEGFHITGGNADLALHDFNYGGGMLIHSADLTVAYCSFEDNAALRSGGALAILSGSPRVEHCSFSGNSANQLGGAIFSEYGAPRITHARFFDNAANGAGGAVALLYSRAEFVNALFDSNLAVFGGAVSNFGDMEPRFTNVTITRNRADLGGGIFSSHTGPRIWNSVLWDNFDNSGNDHQADIFGGGHITHSCIRGGWLGGGGAGNISSNPLLVATGLAAGSPCIDAGNNLAVPADIVTDLAGNTRFHDDPNSADVGESGASPAADPIVDMGAYEYQRVGGPRRPADPADGPLG